ncbi:MG2 domain-containing protein [Verrucomicrobia bacterium]|nr:MG2 domain-containing protein [Verrucomicrobiota bacterium]
MRSSFWMILCCLFLRQTLSAQEPGQTPAFAAAERLFKEGSYQLAYEAYQAMDDPDDAELRTWVRFRRLDSRWRALSGSRQADRQIMDALGRDLEQWTQEGDPDASMTLTEAMVFEASGDFWWTTRYRRDWTRAWASYQKALVFWAASPLLEKARNSYLNIVWKAAHSPGSGRYDSYGNRGSMIPVDVMENAVRIAVDDEDRAHAQYLLGRSLEILQGNAAFSFERIHRAYESAITAKEKHAWLDDALAQYAQWLSRRGKAVKREDGQWTFRPDYKAAARVWRRLLDLYDKGQTRYLQQAESNLKQITGAQLELATDHAFIPGSRIRLYCQWRNVDRFRLKVFPFHLGRDFDLSSRGDSNAYQWLRGQEMPIHEAVYDQVHNTGDGGNHEPGRMELVLEKPLPEGSYMAVTYADGVEQSREWILVSNLSVMARASTNRMLIWVCDARDGTPLGGSEVRLWQRYREGRKWYWRSHDRKTDARGMVVMESTDASAGSWLVTASNGLQQNLSIVQRPGSRSQSYQWKIYAYTDRPVYRPEDEIHWKAILRARDEKGFSTPGGKQLKVRFRDPKGTVVLEESARLNAFGSVHGTWKPTDVSALGMYRIELFNADGKQIGRSTNLFRLEAYKRPEMRLTIGIPEEGGDTGSPVPRPGDQIALEAKATYYFGGPVVGADAEVRVYRKPYRHVFPISRPFAWLDASQARGKISHRQGGGVLEHEMTLKTDAHGKLSIVFESKDNLDMDLSYRVEVRLTDASRREVVAEHEVRVSRQGHFARVETDHRLAQPGDKVSLDFQVVDINERPLGQLEGQVKIIRKRWREVWWTPEGLEIEGSALRAVQQQHTNFPPPPERPDQRPWRLKERGYASEVIVERELRTDDEGHAQWVFSPEKTGYYSVIWTSEDQRPGGFAGPGLEVQATANFWISHDGTRDLGYHSGGVEIIVDRDTFKSGQIAPVMLSVPTSDRWVLLTLESDRLIEHRVIHVEGLVKMVPVDINAAHIPNFYIQAMMVSDHEIHQDSERIVVPPSAAFLNVELITDQSHYEPREEAVVEVRVTDDQGNPVEAEVGLSVYDTSVTYIQSDIAGDPRKRFYGDPRPLVSSFGSHWRRFTKLVASKEYGLLSAEQLQRYLELGGPDISREQSLGMVRGRNNEQDLFYAVESSQLADGASMRMAKSVRSREVFDERVAASPLAMLDADGSAVSQDDMLSEVEVRHDFSATALWEPLILTDKEGRARVTWHMPDTLTTWNVDARCVDMETRVGRTISNVDTRRPLLIRLQTPRFLVLGDQAVLSAIVHNQTDAAVQVHVSLDATNLEWKNPLRDRPPLTIPAGGEQRVDWPGAMAKAPGEIQLTATVRGKEDADAVELTLPVHEHGIGQFLAWSGKFNSDELEIPVTLPRQRRPESTRLTVQVTPSLAVTMLDALPYLVNYPYGCTEQTLSRFVPAVLVRHTLSRLGVSVDDVQPGSFGGVQPEHLDKTHPAHSEGLAAIDAVTADGLERLADFQHPDGGWAWWKDGRSDLFMTSYVVWGLGLALEAEVEMNPGLLRRGRDFLAVNLVSAENQHDLQAWMLHAILSGGKDNLSPASLNALEVAWENLWQHRDVLNAYTRSLLTLVAQADGRDAEALTLIRNLENGVIRSNDPSTSRRLPGTLSGVSGATAHWGEDGIYHRWSQGGVEATAMALRALLTIDPDHPLVEPVVRWLINNRRGAHWSNTRDTAITLYALTAYLEVSGELTSELEYELYAGDTLVAAEKVTPANLFKAPSRFIIPDRLVEDTTRLRIVRTGGKAPVYYAAEASWFSLEEPVPAAGNELFVRRDYFHLKEVPTLLRGSVLERVPLQDDHVLRSGDRVEVVLTLESRNHLEYLLIEDLKPAGLEAVGLRSGGGVHVRQLSQWGIESLRTLGRPMLEPGVSKALTGRSYPLHLEWRDRKVAMFLDRLAEGVWEVRYTLRAEVPGVFHSLPAIGQAMYVPELRGNSSEHLLDIMDRSGD